VDKPLHQFSDTNSIVAISWCPFEKEIVLACTEEKLLLLNVKKGEVGILVEKSFLSVGSFTLYDSSVLFLLFLLSRLYMR